MWFSPILSLLAIVGTVIARASSSTPASPPTAYLFTVNIKSGAPVKLGETPAGQRSFAPISGGNFSGPGLQGKVAGGLDYGLVDSYGSFNPDVVYLLQTFDGCNVLVRERGHAPNVFLLFETSCEKYAWLNTAVAHGKAAQVAGVIAVDVFKVGLYQE
ncbi:unnamed protein product [Discula destructiva]